MILLVLALITAATSIFRYINELPADAYIDKGIHTFKPYAVYPIQVKNTSASTKYRRTNPTKTIYKVFYRTSKIGGYQWSVEVLSKSIGQEIVAEGKPVKRRILSIEKENKYITVDSIYTAESYVSKNKKRYITLFLISMIYLLGFGCYTILKRQK